MSDVPPGAGPLTYDCLIGGAGPAGLAVQVERIDPTTVTLRDAHNRAITIENDFVIPLIGYDPPVAFLKSLGVELANQTNVPRHDPATLETNVPGLFMAGTIVAGNVSGQVFIENSRNHGEQMRPALKRRLSAAASR